MNTEILNRYVPEIKPQEYRIDYYKDGYALGAPHIGNPTGKGGGKRSKVKSFSTASRRRFREFLLTNSIREDYDSFSLSGTVPGPPLSVEDGKKFFKNFSVALTRLNGCGVWRLEVQERGALHWHCIVGLPRNRRPYGLWDPIPREDLKRAMDWSCTVRLKAPHEERIGVINSAMVAGNWLGSADLFDLWFQSLKTLGPAAGFTKKGNPVSVQSRGDWPGADIHAVVIEPLPDVYGSWKRYLFDHTSKVKASQIGENCGRHWGKINKKHFESLLPESFEVLEPYQAHAIRRCLWRLWTPYIKCPGALFGRRKGWVSKRWKSGRSVVFSNPETAKRLTQWAQEIPRPTDDELRKFTNEKARQLHDQITGARGTS